MTTSSEAFLLIMPSYNQAHYIASAIDSVLAQTDPNWMLWIIDNSTDATPEVMQRYTDPRIRFEHIPQRMDPGTCLNWALDRADHRHFSYVHTDNILDPAFVAKMREALNRSEHALAYCDMRNLDEDGRYTGIFRRGDFDLARLFSFSTLGVPFSATLSVARAIGGFNPDDLADDVAFCVKASRFASMQYIPDALVAYRQHSKSRTSDQGGPDSLRVPVLRTLSKVALEFKAHGIDPAAALATKAQRLLLDMALRAEDAWHRHGMGERNTSPCPEALDILLARELLELPGMKNAIKRQSLTEHLKRKLLHRFFTRQDFPRHAVWEESMQFFNHAVPWAILTMGRESDVRIWVAPEEPVAIWLGAVLQDMYGWQLCCRHDQHAQLPSWVQPMTSASPNPPLSTDMKLSINPARLSLLACH